VKITQPSDYETTSLVTLSLGNIAKVSASIQTLRDSVAVIPGHKPRAKLVIRNLTTGTVIHEEECGDSTLSNPWFFVDEGAALIMMTGGGSADGIKVFVVTPSTTRTVLDESYRAAAVMMPNDDLGGDTGFLIVTAEHGSDPLDVKRFQYERGEGRFVATG